MISFDPTRVDWTRPLDISLPLQAGAENPNAFYIPVPEFWPFAVGSFVGQVAAGGACNVNNIRFNPHGNGTHTECVGHITQHFVSLQDCLQRFLFTAVVISVVPEKRGDDEIISLTLLQEALENRKVEALVVRTLPNTVAKRKRQYSGTNPCYFEPAALAWLNEIGVLHLITDQPSVDREEDGGLLLAHHAFWGYPQATRQKATITEMAFIPDEIGDGDYLLNLMIASFVNDASPSKPVLYPLLP